MPVIPCPKLVAPLYFENSHSFPQPLDHVNLWSMVQNPTHPSAASAPYVCPLVERSTVTMSQMNLEMCTESLGSETGSYCLDEMDLLSMSPAGGHEGFTKAEVKRGRKLLSCRKSPTPPFPPPLPSFSRPDRSCILRRSLQCDGRLVIDTVPVPSHNCLQAGRHDGRLLLSFINNSITDNVSTYRMPEHREHVKDTEDFNDKDVECEEVDEEEQEVVEVVDRGIVEVKVSRHQQEQNGPKKVLGSSILIIKFVGGAPLSQRKWFEAGATGIATPATYCANNFYALATSSRRASSEDAGYYCS